MVRTQIQLEEAQSAWLKVTAQQRGVSISQLIRESIEHYRELEKRLPEEKKQAALSAVGQFRSDRQDVSIFHDRFIADAYASGDLP